MSRLKPFFTVVFFFMLATTVFAQEDEPASTINWFYTACEDRMVIDLDGTIQTGYDVYFQAFDGFGGTGNPLTGLRRVSVNGDYAVSQVVNYTGGTTKVLGQPVSVVISMARETDPENTIFSEPSDDFIGECHEPSSTLTTSQDLTSGEFAPGEVVSFARVWTPAGTRLNPVYYTAPEPIVQIGARPSDTRIVGRTTNPGLIFAECRDVQGADPGVIFDTDEIVVFWSWFARTPQQVQDHINNAQYFITLNGQAFPDVSVSPIRTIDGSVNYWVFYTVNLGDRWRPGGYGINFRLEWVNPISDGYDDYGPGTEIEFLDSGCYFEVTPNPYGVTVQYQQPSVPLKTFN